MHQGFAQTPLGQSSGPSRFSPVQSAAGIACSDPTFRVIYLAEDRATAVSKTLIRDRFDLDLVHVLLWLTKTHALL